jgi:regulator of sigma E protease
VVSAVSPKGAAEIAGLKPGDRIVSFNNVENPSWDRINGDALLSPEKPLPVTVERGGQRISLTITPTKLTEGTDTIGMLDFLPDYGNVPIVVDGVLAGAPADKAGLKPGDRIVSVGGNPVHSSEQVRAYIREHKAEPIHMMVDRNGQQQEIVATVGKIGEGKEGLGFTPAERVPRERVGPIAALRYAVDSNVEILRLTAKAIGQLFSGERSARNTLSGPIGIYRAASTSATQLGWAGVFSMLGFLSLSLGVFNLLPIPVLDGGAIFLLLVEGVLGWIGIKLSINMRERIQQVGFVMLLLLMGFVITNDLLKEASLLRGWGDDKPAAVQQNK